LSSGLDVVTLAAVASGCAEIASLTLGLTMLLLGALGTVVGFAIVGGSVQKTHGAGVSLLAGGIKVSLYPAIFGLLLLTVAIVAWLALQIFNWRREAQAPA